MTPEPVSLAPTTRFSNRVENYVRYRPGYPPEIIDFFEKKLGLSKNACIADIGSGTGLFAEPLLQRGYSVICVEPNEKMRKASEAWLGHFSNFISRSDRAEATSLCPNSVDLITAAQAFHWFNPDACKKEFHRILKPGGHIVLAWNIQKNHSSFMQAFAELKELYSLENTIPTRIDTEKIREFFSPGVFEKNIYQNIQFLDFDGLKGQLLSSSYIPLPGHISYETMISALVQLFVNSNENGFVKMEFETIVYSGRIN